jgi:hypothetical protein
MIIAIIIMSIAIVGLLITVIIQELTIGRLRRINYRLNKWCDKLESIYDIKTDRASKRELLIDYEKDACIIARTEEEVEMKVDRYLSSFITANK